MKYLTNIDLTQQQLLNATIQNLATAPSTPVQGQIYFNATDHRLYVYNGTSWIGCDSTGATMTGDNIISAINSASSKIDDDNLSTNVGTAIADAHIHGNAAALAAVSGSNTGDQTLSGLGGIAANVTITGATKTKITYDSKGLVTAGADATTADIADSVGKRYTPEAVAPVAGKLTVLGVANGETVFSNKVLIDSVTPTALVSGDAAAVGTAITAARADHKHAIPTVPTLSGLGGVPITTTVNGHTLSGNVNVTASDLSLGNVTNDAQVKKATSSTNGSIPKWSGTTGDVIVDGYTVETSLVGGTGALPRADAVKTYVDGIIAAQDAMVFKGIIDASANPNYPAADRGWTYKISVAGKIGGASGKVVEVGDIILCITDATVTGTDASVGTNWAIIQTNIDGAVTGPASAVSGNFASFNGTGGKVVQDSGSSAASFATATHNHDATYPKKYVIACGTSTTWIVNHALNTREVHVTIRETASPYSIVYTDVVMTDLNNITITFAVAPTSGQYTAIVIG